ncbi:MAG: hypothetical protein V3U87_07090 [Methylococcaceae bacterium]
MDNHPTDKGELVFSKAIRPIIRLNPLSVISESASNGNSGSQTYYQGFDCNSDTLGNHH